MINRIKLNRGIILRCAQHVLNNRRTVLTTSMVRTPVNPSPTDRTPDQDIEGHKIDPKLLFYIRQDSMKSFIDKDRYEVYENVHLPKYIRRRLGYENIKHLLISSKHDPDFPKLLVESGLSLPPEFDPKLVPKHILLKRIGTINAWIEMGYDPANFRIQALTQYGPKRLKERFDILSGAGLRPLDYSYETILAKKFRQIIYMAPDDLNRLANGEKVAEMQLKRMRRIDLDVRHLSEPNRNLIKDLTESISDHLNGQEKEEMYQHLKKNHSNASLLMLSYEIIKYYLELRIGVGNFQDFSQGKLSQKALLLKNSLKIIDLIANHADCKVNYSSIDWWPLFNRMDAEIIADLLENHPFINSTHISKFFKHDCLSLVLEGSDTLRQKISFFKNYGFGEYHLDDSYCQVLSYRLETLQQRVSYWSEIIPKEVFLTMKGSFCLLMNHEMAKFRLEHGFVTMEEMKTLISLESAMKKLCHPSRSSKSNDRHKSRFNRYQIARLKDLCLKYNWIKIPEGVDVREYGNSDEYMEQYKEIQSLLVRHVMAHSFGLLSHDSLIDYLLKIGINSDLIKSAPYIILYPLEEIKIIVDKNLDDFKKEWGLDHPRLLDMIIYLFHFPEENLRPIPGMIDEKILMKKSSPNQDSQLSTKSYLFESFPFKLSDKDKRMIQDFKN